MEGSSSTARKALNRN